MELFIKLGLKEIASIIQTLGETHDVSDFSDVFEINGKQYHIMKEKDELIITTQDGRNMCIGINYNERKGKDFQNRDVTFTKHEAEIDYYLDDGSSINLKNQLPLSRGYEGFTSVQRHDLLSGLVCKYYNQNGEPVSSFTIGLNKLCLNGSKKVYEFTDEGILCGNKLVSLEGDKLLSISGSEVPELSLMESFDIEQEKEKISRFAESDESLHPFTKEALQDATRLLDRKNRRVKEVCRFYDEELKELRTAIAIRHNINSLIDEDVIRPDELEEINSMLRQKLLTNKKLSLKN